GVPAHGKSAGFPHPLAARYGCLTHKSRKDIAKHIRTGRRQKANATVESTVSIYRKQIARPQGIVFVDLEFAVYGDIPAEPVLEDCLPNAMHLIQIADVAFCIVFRDNSYQLVLIPCIGMEHYPTASISLSCLPLQVSCARGD